MEDQEEYLFHINGISSEVFRIRYPSKGDDHISCLKDFYKLLKLMRKEYPWFNDTTVSIAFALGIRGMNVKLKDIVDYLERVKTSEPQRQSKAERIRKSIIEKL